MQSFLTSLRLTVITLLLGVVGYTASILGFAQAVCPHTANGSLLTGADGVTVVGSLLLAQAFGKPEYFWPRPSAVDYNAAGAGGSNKSPTSPSVNERAQRIIAMYGASAQNPLPPDLATASGAGLDPHVTERAARYQAARVATARHLAATEVDALISRLAFAPGGFLTAERIVNVLELNLALDRQSR